MKRLSIVLFTLTFAFNASSKDQEEMVEEAISALEEGIALLKDGNINDGAEEVRWGLDLIDKAKQSGINQFFIDENG